MKAIVKAKAEPGLWLEEGVAVSKSSGIACISRCKGINKKPPRSKRVAAFADLFAVANT
jgi:hypothetical protein